MQSYAVGVVPLRPTTDVTSLTCHADINARIRRGQCSGADHAEETEGFDCPFRALHQTVVVHEIRLTPAISPVVAIADYHQRTTTLPDVWSSKLLRCHLRQEYQNRRR
jgi:hypothetical protein